jgi:hypothetical protein
MECGEINMIKAPITLFEKLNAEIAVYRCLKKYYEARHGSR